jgi:hypothetical protein
MLLFLGILAGDGVARAVRTFIKHASALDKFFRVCHGGIPLHTHVMDLHGLTGELRVDVEPGAHGAAEGAIGLSGCA